MAPKKNKRKAMNKVSEETENSQDSNPPDNENNNHVGRIANKRR